MTLPPDSSDPLPNALAEQLLRAARDERVLAELEVKIRAAGPAPARSSEVQLLEKPPVLEPGSKLGEYVLDERLGRGGMGTVYKAHRHDRSVPNTYYAIKVLNHDTIIPEADTKFQDEARFLSSLQSQDHIVPLYHALVDRAIGVPFLVMPLINGESLAHYIDQKQGEPSSWLWVADVIRQVATGLMNISKALPRLVHRDLKPGNILLAYVSPGTHPAGVRALIADFGLSILSDARPKSFIAPLLGTVKYFSPEYIRNSAQINPLSDIFSLGVIATELLTGVHPFVMGTDTQYTVMERICKDVPGTRIFPSDVPAELADIVRRMMSQSPLDRLRADEVVTGLTQVLNAPRKSMQVAPVAPPGPPSPRLGREPEEIFGRDVAPAHVGGVTLDIEAAAIADVTNPQRSRLYWGQGGIGKSTFALKLAYHPLVAGTYGPRRYQVKLDGVTSAQGIETGIKECLGISGTNSESNVDEVLRDGRLRLIILDTLDGPLEYDRNAVNQLLNVWGQIPQLTLIHTSRSGIFPNGDWLRRVEIGPLPTDAIRRIFLKIAGCYQFDPALERVLSLADGLPLAAELLGYAACEYPKLDSFLQAWDRSRAKLLNTVPGPNRSASIQCSVAFSLDHSRLKGNCSARRLLRLLADLPDGLFLTDLQAGFTELYVQALPSLNSTGGLARISDERITMLSPIREELRLVPRNEIDWEAAVRYMSQTVSDQSFAYHDQHSVEALAWFRAMRRNLEELLLYGIAQTNEVVIAGVQGAARFGIRMGIDYRYLLVAAVERASEKQKAICQRMIADVLEHRGNLDEALRLHRVECLSVFEHLGDVREIAITWGRIADVLEQRGDPDEALRIYRVECLPVFEHLGDVREIAITWGRIADVLEQRGDPDEALRIRQQKCLPVFGRLGDIRETATAWGKIADVLRQQGYLDEVLRIRREEELPVYNRLGDVRSRAVTWGKIADVLRQQGYLDEVLRIRREEELPAYEQLGDVREKAVTWGKIADVMWQQGQLDEVLRIRREEELPVYERLEDMRSQGVTWGKIADVLRQWGQLDEALRLYQEQCLPVYNRLRDVRSRAVTWGKIADVLWQRGQPDEALRLYQEQCLPVFERLKDVRSRAVTWGKIADVMEQQGQLDEVLRIRRAKSLPAYEHLKDVRSQAVTWGKIADVLRQVGQIDEALRLYREQCLPVFEQLKDVREKAITWRSIADVLRQQGQFDEAIRLYREQCLPAFEQLQDVREKAITWSQIADAQRQWGQADEAIRLYREQCLPAFEQLQDVRRIVLCQKTLAEILMVRNQPHDQSDAQIILEQALVHARNLKLRENSELQSLLNTLKKE